MNLKFVTFALACGMMTNLASAATTKYTCKFADGSSHPLEINLADRVSYVDKDRPLITGTTKHFITMISQYEVGGSISVLNLDNGELRSVAVGQVCLGGPKNCAPGVAKPKLHIVELDVPICTKT